MDKKKKGFTLIELVIVMALVGIIITFVGVALSGTIANFGNNQKYTQEKNDANTVLLFFKNKVRFASKGVTLSYQALENSACYYSKVFHEGDLGIDENTYITINKMVDKLNVDMDEPIKTFNKSYSFQIDFSKINDNTVGITLKLNNMSFTTNVSIINPSAKVNTNEDGDLGRYMLCIPD